MKTFDSGLAAQYESRQKTLAYFLYVQRADGLVYGFTTADIPVVYLGVAYQPWLNVSAIVQAAGLAVNNLETKILYEGPFVKSDFLSGRWNGARWELFEASWTAPLEGVNTLGKYVTGEVKPNWQDADVEMRALSQFLQQPIGIVTSKTCRARFADYPTPILDSLCRLDAAGFIEVGVVSDVLVDQLKFADVSMVEPDDWFSEGVLTFTSGDNIGLSQKVKLYENTTDTTNGPTFTLSMEFPFSIEVGDEYEVIAGCRKRREDCRDKFDNILNMQAEPDVPGVDAATKTPARTT